MLINWNALIRVTGSLSILAGISMSFPLIVGFIYGESHSIRAFVYTILSSLILGIFLIFLSHRGRKARHVVNLKIRDGFLIVSVSWILFSAIGAFPYIIEGCIPHYIDAFFETSSGFTTTGSSILNDIESLPKAMQFWRMFTHWLGGMGILVLAIALLPGLGISGQTILKAETPGPTFSKMTPKISDTAKTLYITYTAFTILETLLLMAGGVGLFDALTHTFATVGTGGFSNYSDSIAHFDSAYVESIIVLFMILSGINFNLYILFLSGKSSRFIKDSELKMYLTIIGVSTALLTFYLYFSDLYGSLLTAFRYGIFQVVSILTTTGFMTTDFDLWPTFCTMILFFLLLSGSCSSSTAGGIKVVRILVVFKMIKRSALLKLHPNALIPITLDDQPMPGETVQGISSFVFLYTAIIFSVGLLVSLDGSDLITSFSAAATCLGNVGPGFHQVGPAMNFGEFSYPIKLLLSFTMITGRLELFTFLMLLSGKFWRPAH